MKKILLLLFLIPVLSWAEKFEVIDPQGKKHIVTTPEGATAEDAMRYIQQKQQQQVKPVLKNKKNSKAINDCFIKVSKSAKTTYTSKLGQMGCHLKHSNSFFSSKRQLGKCLISVAKSAKTTYAAKLGQMGCKSKYN